MKKIRSLFLAAALSLLVLGCKAPAAQTEPATPPAPEQSMQAGFGRQSITPSTSVGLAGLEKIRDSQGILDTLQATCVALTDPQGQTALLVSLDVLAVPAELTARLTEQIATETGVEQPLILLCATGTHSGPDLTDEAYLAFFTEAVVQSAQAAMADRSGATLRIGQSHTKDLTAQSPYNMDIPNPVADDSLRLIRLERKGAQDILLVSWQCRADLAATNQETAQLMSADFVGAARELVEQEEVLFAYFQGAAGNIEPREAAEVTAFGGQFGQAVVSAMKKLKKQPAGALAVRESAVTCSYDHADDKKVAVAQQITDLWQTRQDAQACIEMGKPHSIRGYRHAQAILDRSQLGQSEQIPVKVVAVGDMAFAAAPCMLYDGTGAYIRDGSGFAMTVLLTGTGGDWGILPAAEAYDYGNETVDLRSFKRGSAEAVARELKAHLEALKPE